MDECPRCGGELEELALADVSTVSCSRCGFADIPVEHLPNEEDVESWRDAFNRFYEQSAER
ncbi:zf-TFIIB domain-containing protein [Natrinema marinum]|uniref:zf-TFIIB domain-containing protein n=1 Tax=Natrinema marinum TaxID=2961598 RepID=UPI0020C85B1F|nr:zf-TFIIB domain-containing protein [Natrinema marinum]